VLARSLKSRVSCPVDGLMDGRKRRYRLERKGGEDGTACRLTEDQSRGCGEQMVEVSGG
jgi:hypothetical protein